jgi:hypothetical protein
MDNITKFSFTSIFETVIEFVDTVTLSIVKSSLTKLSMVEESFTSKAVVVLVPLTPLICVT